MKKLEVSQLENIQGGDQLGLCLSLALLTYTEGYINVFELDEMFTACEEAFS